MLLEQRNVGVGEAIGLTLGGELGVAVDLDVTGELAGDLAARALVVDLGDLVVLDHRQELRVVELLLAAPPLGAACQTSSSVSRPATMIHGIHRGRGVGRDPPGRGERSGCSGGRH